jgi:glycosyltransferase involved in cell wall biosynthesis
MPARLSVAIVACNEAANLRRTLASLSRSDPARPDPDRPGPAQGDPDWPDEIVLVDSGSTDETLEIARQFHARVFVEPWKGYGPQVNSAIDKCAGDWILNLDADEALTPELRAEIQALLAGNPDFPAYWIPRLNLFLGRWMRHGGVYPDRKLRLFRRGTARLREDTEPHATPKWDGPAGRLKAHMLHYAYPDLDVYLEHMARYSTASIPLMLGKGKTSRGLPAFVVNTFLNPVATFLYNYFLRLGFLDGREGLLFHLYHSVYVSWKYAKAWQSARSENTRKPAVSPRSSA